MTLETIVYKKHPRAKHLRITVKRDGQVVVTIPRFCTRRRAELFASSRMDWVLEQQEKIKNGKTVYTKDPVEIENLRQMAKDYILPQVENFASQFGFVYNDVRIKNITSRWGSCSSKKNLNFSLHLMQFEKKYIDYVIWHELCHLKHMNHGPKFWALLEKVYPGAKVLDREMGKITRQDI